MFSKKIIKQEKEIEDMFKLPRDTQLQGNPGLTVYDEETGEFVQVTKQDIKAWVKEAIKEMEGE